MQDRFTDFCNDDTVQEALCDIVTNHVDDWFHASCRVRMGVDSSWVARQQVLLSAARVLGMMDLTPEDVVELEPEKYRALILYVANYK